MDAYSTILNITCRRIRPDDRKVIKLESGANAVAIYKTIRSTSPLRGSRREYLYIIQSTNLVGAPIYSKGKLVADAGIKTYCFLISAKRAE